MTSAAVEQSYRHCQQVVREASSNFVWSFALLPRPQRRAMYALYAFARHADDLADSNEPLERKRASLAALRSDLEQALAGQPQGALLPALADTAARFEVPPQYLFEIVRGVEMDLDHRGFATFDELTEYCYYVASAVGLACLHIWGGARDDAYEPAVDCGIAFQLTNVLRDLKEDAVRGRVYLPQDDIQRHGCDSRRWQNGGPRDEGLTELVRFQAARARGYYQSAARLERYLSGPPRSVFAMMYGTYAELLEQISRQPEIVLARRVRVPLWSKLGIARRALFARIRVDGPATLRKE